MPSFSDNHQRCIFFSLSFSQPFFKQFYHCIDLFFLRFPAEAEAYRSTSTREIRAHGSKYVRGFHGISMAGGTWRYSNSFERFHDRWGIISCKTDVPGIRQSRSRMPVQVRLESRMPNPVEQLLAETCLPLSF